MSELGGEHGNDWGISSQKDTGRIAGPAGMGRQVHEVAKAPQASLRGPRFAPGVMMSWLGGLWGSV